MSDALSYYKILNLTEGANEEDIKNAYRSLAKKWHPDSNATAQATDVFQKISVAYEVLSHPQKRLLYDILSLCYDKTNFPDFENLEPITDKGEGVCLRAVTLRQNKGLIFSYEKTEKLVAAREREALLLHFKTACVNWLLGWGHPKTFLANIKAIFENFARPLSTKESIKIMAHNAAAFFKKNKPAEAAACAREAQKLLKRDVPALQKLLLETRDAKVLSVPKQRILPLRLVQLVVPAALLMMAGVLGTEKENFVNGLDISRFFSKQKEIDYYQKVDFGTRGESVDDVVVGKVLSIPVDKTDRSKLYYVTSTVKVMYGPSDDFDAIKTLEEGTTVRLTGITPDNVWARVLIDNGELGFVHYKILKPGIGHEIPFGSAIVE